MNFCTPIMYFQKTLLYDVDDVWKGKRNMFMPSHRHELKAVKLLTKLDINSENIQHTVQKYDIDLDVADSLGNTRLMISSVIFYISIFIFITL